MQNSEPEIFIDKYCSVKKSDNRLTILMNESKVSLFYQFKKKYFSVLNQKYIFLTIYFMFLLN